RVDEPRDFYDRRCRPNLAENLSMSFCDFLPLSDVSHEHTRPNDIFNATAKRLDRRADDLKRTACLLEYLAGIRSVGVDAYGSRHGNDMAASHGPRISDDGLPFRTRTCTLPSRSRLNCDVDSACCHTFPPWVKIGLLSYADRGMGKRGKFEI